MPVGLVGFPKNSYGILFTKRTCNLPPEGTPLHPTRLALQVGGGFRTCQGGGNAIHAQATLKAAGSHVAHQGVEDPARLAIPKGYPWISGWNSDASSAQNKYESCESCESCAAKYIMYYNVTREVGDRKNIHSTPIFCWTKERGVHFLAWNLQPQSLTSKNAIDSSRAETDGGQISLVVLHIDVGHCCAAPEDAHGSRRTDRVQISTAGITCDHSRAGPCASYFIQFLWGSEC